MLALDGVGFIKNSPNFTPWAFDVSYAFSCAMSSQIKISWNDAELTDQWLSFWRGNAGRWIRHVTSQGASIANTALHRTNARGAAQRTTGGEQQRKILRRWGRPGEASSSWRRTGRCGGSTLLPYMPLRCKGHEWVEFVKRKSISL